MWWPMRCGGSRPASCSMTFGPRFLQMETRPSANRWIYCFDQSRCACQNCERPKEPLRMNLASLGARRRLMRSRSGGSAVQGESILALDPNCQCLAYRSASTVAAVIVHARHRMCGCSGCACIRSESRSTVRSKRADEFLGILEAER